MTKNSGPKKAARKYQQEHPGTTFPEAMRAITRPVSEEPSTPVTIRELRDVESNWWQFDPANLPILVNMDPVRYLEDRESPLPGFGKSSIRMDKAQTVVLAAAVKDALEIRGAGELEFDEAERTEITSWDGHGKSVFADYARLLDERLVEAMRERKVRTENFMRWNGVVQAMTTHTVEDRPTA